MYISDQDTCPSPVDDSDVKITPCDVDTGDGVCGLDCQDSPSKYISAPIPHYQPCGVLGVYNWNMPSKKFVLPTCSGMFCFIWLS